MTTERRTHARGKTTAKVTFTDATSETPSEGELHDIGRGGMFVATKTPLPAGKRIDFEVQVTGGAAITGMARVIWVREAAVGDLPAGMGIKYIDVDDSALVAIDRLVGLKKNVRERTVLGIPAPAVLPAEAPKVEAPKVEAAKVEAPKVEAPKVEEKPKMEPPRPLKSRERTVLGIAPPAPREQELSWEEAPAAPPEPVKELVKEPEPEPVKEIAPEPVAVKEPEPEPVKEVASAVAAPEPEPEPVKEVKPPPKTAVVEEPPPPRELPKREGGGAGKWILILLIVGGLAGAAYYFRDKIIPPEVSPTPTVSASASTAPSTAPSASAAPSASTMDIADASPNVADATAIETMVDASASDAAMHDGGHDGGDGGKHHHDAGAAGATTTTQHHAKPKPSASAAADNPY